MGSCIFLHLNREGYPPTEGCVAIARPDLEDLLAVAKPAMLRGALALLRLLTHLQLGVGRRALGAGFALALHATLLRLAGHLLE